jgi:hypothetical protein
MSLRILCCLFAGYFPFVISAQDIVGDSGITRSSTPLDSITVTAFRNNATRAQLPASIVLLTSKEISLMGSLSMLPVFNQVPAFYSREFIEKSFWCA